MLVAAPTLQTLGVEAGHDVHLVGEVPGGVAVLEPASITVE